MPLVPPIQEALSQLGEVTREYSDVLTEPIANHASRVAAWRAAGVDGIFFGICDAGVTQPTLLLAAAAEAAGIPTVVLCTEQVMQLAAVSASFMLPGLPLVLLDASRIADAEQLRRSALAAAPDIIAGLTETPAVLREKVRARFSFIEGLARETDAQPVGDYSAYASQRRMSDGLPLVEPTRAKVDALIAASGKKAGDRLLASMSPSGAPLTVEQAAICSVMAGCAPSRFALVLAALKAMSDPRYQLHLSSITTHPGTNLLLFSGPAAAAAGIASGRGCLGPGNEANLTIGRSVSLIMINVARAIPGLSTLSAFGSPAQLACCFADADNAALPPLHAELCGPSESLVWALKAESPHNCIDHQSTTPESLLSSIASVAATLGANNAYYPSDLLVMLNPEHAEIIARAGWGRKQAQQFLWETARNPRDQLLTRGVKPEWPEAWRSWSKVPVVPAADRICIVVAGGGGPQSMVAIPWGLGAASWTRI